jgi:hypothetical protein
LAVRTRTSAMNSSRSVLIGESLRIAIGLAAI